MYPSMWEAPACISLSILAGGSALTGEFVLLSAAAPTHRSLARCTAQNNDSPAFIQGSLSDIQRCLSVHLLCIEIPFTIRADSAEGGEGKKGETLKTSRENDENGVMAARAEGQTRMLWSRTKHSKRDGQQEKRGEGTEKRRRTVVLGRDVLTPRP